MQTGQPRAASYESGRVSNGAIFALKQTGSGAAYLTFLILMSLQMLASFSTVVAGAIGIRAFGSYAGFAGGTMLITWLVSNAMPVIMLVGLWKIYASSRKPGGYMNSSGLSVVNVIMWIYCILAAVIFLLASLAFIIIGASQEIGALTAIGVFVLILGIPLFIYYLFAAKSVQSAKKTAQTGVKPGKASVYVAVINIIFAVSSLFSLFTISAARGSILNLFYQFNIPGEVVRPLMSLIGSGGMLGTISGLLGVAVYITSSVVIFQYNSKLASLTLCAPASYMQNVNPYSRGVTDAPSQNGNNPM